MLTTSVSTRVVQSKDNYKLQPTRCKVWNPVDGTMSPLVSRTSDIFDVWVVYDSDNMWGNIQQAGLPCDLNWDLNDKRCSSEYFKKIMRQGDLRVGLSHTAAASV